jgi:hypothetical protein
VAGRIILQIHELYLNSNSVVDGSKAEITVSNLLWKWQYISVGLYWLEMAEALRQAYHPFQGRN